MSRTTGQVCPVSGVYRAVGNCGHSVERVIPAGHAFPPCEYCREKGERKDITWVLGGGNSTQVIAHPNFRPARPRGGSVFNKTALTFGHFYQPIRIQRKA